VPDVDVADDVLALRVELGDLSGGRFEAVDVIDRGGYRGVQLALELTVEGRLLRHSPPAGRGPSATDGHQHQRERRGCEHSPVRPPDFGPEASAGAERLRRVVQPGNVWSAPKTPPQRSLRPAQPFGCIGAICPRRACCWRGSDIVGPSPRHSLERPRMKHRGRLMPRLIRDPMRPRAPRSPRAPRLR
jgi:hypothetical protein